MPFIFATSDTLFSGPNKFLKTQDIRFNKSFFRSFEIDCAKQMSDFILIAIDTMLE